MPRVPSVSPATGKPTPSYYIHTTDSQFVDNAGRTLLLRGVNLSGANKAPLDGPSYLLDDFWESGETGETTFTGRPLNLDDGSADVHLARLRGWGFNVLRYVVTWESLEHAGPGKYDYEFMDYTVRVLRKCQEFGFRVYMDPHQDIWSRYSGGSGAPYWTLPACGFDPRHFTATQAAIVHCEYPSAESPDPAKLPAMIWSTNYGRLASQTLFTLFFAGRDFAPKCILDGQNIQDYLQGHFIEAFGQLADRIRAAGDLLDSCVIGWDSMNEPYEGLCGYPDLTALPTKQGSTLKKGTAPTPAQSMRLGMGQAQTVENWKFGAMGPARDGSVTIDPRGRKAWAEPGTEPGRVHPRWGWRRDAGWVLGTCVWAQHGVWDVQSGFVVAPEYFCTPPVDADHDVEFIEDYWKAHWEAFARRIRRAHPEAIMFAAPPVFAQPPPLSEGDLQGRCCYSAHYYDGLTLVTRSWNWFNADALGLLRGKYSSTLLAVKIGEKAIRKSLQQQLGILQSDAPILGPYPTIIGEIGIPYDMDGKKAYGWTHDGKYKGDYSSQQRALDASLNAADGPNALNYTIWNYCPDHSHAWGDMWNMEDLSLWSPDDLRPKSEYKMGMEGASSSVFLKEPVVRTQSARNSSLSLATLPVGNGISEQEVVEPKEITSFAQWENAYDFLTDGARAVKAFCRPYPTAVVGVPKDIQFDIAKAEFRLVVRVRPEDAPQLRSLAPSRTPSTSSSASSIDAPAEDAAPATEIYLPVVHFASGELTSRFAEQQCDTPTTLAGDREGPKRADAAASAPSSARWEAYSPLFAPQYSALAVSVAVSEGRYAIEGQTLRWWYGVPPPGAAEREYTIVISRAGGAIRAAGQESGGAGVLEQLWTCVGEACGVM